MGRIQTGKRKRQWTPEEDEKLIACIEKHGEGNWQALPKPAGLNRSWRSCRLRWMNYLRPEIKRGNFSPEEEELIVKLHSLLGDKWTAIAGCLSGRTDNEIKNFWHIHLQKKLIQKGIDPVTHRKFSQERTDNDEIKSSNSLGERKGSASHQPIQGELRTFEDDALHLSNCPMDQKLYSGSAHNISSTGHHDASVLAAAAIRIQNKFRTWKGRKDFLIIRQQIVKIQAHVKGHQVRKNCKEIVWYLGTLEKFILRWRKTGSSLHGFKSEALTRDGSSTLDTSSNEDDFHFLKEGRKQIEEVLKKAPAAVKSVVQDLEAGAQYHRLLNTVNKIQGTKFWKEILEDCDPGVGSQHLHPPFSSIQPDTLGNFPKQVHETLGELSTNGFCERQEFGIHLPIQGELQGKASTQFADVASESIMDYTNEFSKYKIFKSKEELIECTHEIGRKNGFVIVIKRSDSGNGGQRARITFCCERGGQYRNRSKDKEDKKENTNTKKCACPFELKAYKLSVDDNWELKVKWGVHNHPITKPREGRSYMGSLTKKERLLVEEEFKRKKCTVDILKSLENTTFNNVSTRKHIYNARQRYKVKELAESSNNTVNSNSFNNFFPVGLRRYIDHCKDVEADGNCGFRAIADLVGFGEKEWLRVKKDLLTELNSKLEDYRLLYGNDERIKELIDALSNFKSHPSFDGWMTMPDMGHLIASAYNVVLIHFSMQQCLTFLPLRSVPVPTDSRKEIAIGFVNNNHFVEVFLLPGCPIPPIATNWYKFRHSCAKEWEDVYISRIECFKKVVGNDVATNEIIDIESNSFNNEPDELVHANLLKDDFEGGASWAFEVGSQTMVCPIMVEDLNPPGQMLVQMLFEEEDFFLKIANFFKGIGLTILMRVMESRNDKIWARFYIKANYNVTRIEILMSIVRFHEQTVSSQTWDAESDYSLSRVRSTSMFSPNWVSDYGDYLPDRLDQVNFSLSRFPLGVPQDYFPDVLDWGNLEAMPDDAFKSIDTSLESQPFHPSLSSTQCDTLGNIPKQGNEIVGTHSTNSFGEGKEFDTHLPI